MVINLYFHVTDNNEEINCFDINGNTNEIGSQKEDNGNHQKIADVLLTSGTVYIIYILIIRKYIYHCNITISISIIIHFYIF